MREIWAVVADKNVESGRFLVLRHFKSYRINNSRQTTTAHYLEMWGKGLQVMSAS
jgi:hypothetical protein